MPKSSSERGKLYHEKYKNDPEYKEKALVLVLVEFNDAFNTIRLCKRQLSFVFILAILFLLKTVKIIFDHLKFLNYLHYLQ